MHPVLSIVTAALGAIWHFGDKTDKANDEHMQLLIANALNPATKTITDHIDAKADDSDRKLASLSDRVSHIEGSLGKRISALESSPSKQLSLARFVDSQKALSTNPVEPSCG